MRVDRDLDSDAEESLSKAKTKAPEQTFEEVKYLRHLIDKAITVRIRLSSNEEVVGVIEFYDSNFIRVTRLDAPNLFLTNTPAVIALLNQQLYVFLLGD